MAKKIYRLTKAAKAEIENNWYKTGFKPYGGAALAYVKQIRAAAMQRVEAAKAEAARLQKKAERSVKYYDKNPIVINGRPLPVDSLSFEQLKNEAAKMGKTPRHLARLYEQSGLAGETANFYMREAAAIQQLKPGDKIIINGKKSSKAALKKRLRTIRNIAANYSTGFDMQISFDYDKKGNVFFNLPTFAQLEGITDSESFEELFDGFDDLSVTISG